PARESHVPATEESSRFARPGPSSKAARSTVVGVSGVTPGPESAAIPTDRAVQTRKEEDMRHPAKVWTDPDFERESLERLRVEFRRNNLMGYGAHGRKLSIPSVDKYDFTLLDFIRSLERHGIEPELGALTPDNVAAWQRDQEERGNS